VQHCWHNKANIHKVMTTMTNPITGANYFLRGLSLIRQPGVKRFVIIPLLINALIFTLLLWFISAYIGEFIDWLTPSLPDWLAWLSWLIWLLFAVSGGIILFFTFTILANLVGAPFNSYLSAAVEKHLTGQRPAAGNRPLSEEIVYALGGELRKLLYFLMWGVPLLIASMIPALNLIAPVLWAFFGAWMLAIEYADYPLGNCGLAFPEIRKKLSQKKFLSLGFGGAVMLGTMIPLFNFLVMPVAVAGATAMRVEQFK